MGVKTKKQIREDRREEFKSFTGEYPDNESVLFEEKFGIVISKIAFAETEVTRIKYANELIPMIRKICKDIRPGRS